MKTNVLQKLLIHVSNQEMSKVKFLIVESQKGNRHSYIYLVTCAKDISVACEIKKSRATEILKLIAVTGGINSIFAYRHIAVTQKFMGN